MEVHPHPEWSRLDRLSAIDRSANSRGNRYCVQFHLKEQVVPANGRLRDYQGELLEFVFLAPGLKGLGSADILELGCGQPRVESRGRVAAVVKRRTLVISDRWGERPREPLQTVESRGSKVEGWAVQGSKFKAQGLSDHPANPVHPVQTTGFSLKAQCFRSAF